MNQFPHGWGRPRDDIYGPYDHSYLQHPDGAFQHTQHPIVVGTSVVAVMYKDGVVIVADTLASFGSLAKYRDVNRLFKFNDRIVLGFGGDISDMQAINRMLSSLQISEIYAAADNGSDPSDTTPDSPSSSQSSSSQSPSSHLMSANNLYSWLTKLFYARRSKFDPLWNNVLVVGLDSDDKPFLSGVDLLATAVSAPCIATGFGAHVAIPILRKLVPDQAAVEHVTKEQAVEAVKECMKVLFYRDARSLDNYNIAVVSRDGVDIQQNQPLGEQNWGFADRVRGYGTQIN